MSGLDWNGMPLPAPCVRSIEQAVAECYQGYRANAAKRGRNPRWPYVPIVMRPQTSIGRPDLFTKQQILGKAFTTREEAIAHADRTISFWSDRFAKQLADPRMRAIRAQWGVPDSACADPIAAERLNCVFGREAFQ